MSTPMLVIGNKNYSSWSLRAWLALAHLGTECDVIRVPLYVDGFKKTLCGYSPAGKVPVYIDGETTIWDSLAICEYLAETHPALWPADATARALARSISAEMHAGFTAIRNEMPMNCRAVNRTVSFSTAVENEVARIDDMWTTCRSEFSPGGPWLFGDFSIADAMYAPVASRLHTYGIVLGAAANHYKDTVLSDPNMQQWFSDSVNEKEVIEIAELG